ncbi:pilus assembly protein PilC [Candidatus Saccharibacteria bacterium RIFCSPHIGHO2_02_FULL_47_12]|nr:MAG: pilus assembly protein PilC [Candidatus Saccharibacteria bacterium RIFCSPHIGHO2_02_FULL_47_12]
MLTFKYTARDPASGKKVESQIQADNEATAAKLIRGQGLAPLDISLTSDEKHGYSKLLNRIKSKDKVLFSRQLSTLINAGLPLVQSLRSVQSQTTNKAFKAVINTVITDLESGSALSAAMGRHPHVFNSVYINLVAAGEASGTLDKTFERLANQQEKDAELISKVRGAMIYPAIVIFVMLLVVGFMVIKVLPQVELLYSDLPGANLPLVTRLLLGVSKALTRFWWVALVLLLVGGFFTSRWARTLGGKSVIDRLKMRIWPIGSLFMKMYMARFARTGQTLVASGVPLIQMLDITSSSVNNVHISKSIDAAIEKVKGGKALSDSISGDPNFLELVPNMLKIGEQSGAIEQMLAKIADYYEKEVDNEIKTISTIIEPVLMVMLGVMAFIIVAAVLLPIYGLAGQNIIK